MHIFSDYIKLFYVAYRKLTVFYYYYYKTITVSSRLRLVLIAYARSLYFIYHFEWCLLPWHVRRESLLYKLQKPLNGCKRKNTNHCITCWLYSQHTQVVIGPCDFFNSAKNLSNEKSEKNLRQQRVIPHQ